MSDIYNNKTSSAKLKLTWSQKLVEIKFWFVIYLIFKLEMLIQLNLINALAKISSIFFNKEDIINTNLYKFDIWLGHGFKGLFSGPTI